MKTKIKGRRIGFTQLKLLVLTFCICETIFFIQVGSEVEEILFFLIILMPPIPFLLLGKKWAKWVVSTLLVLNGIFLFFGGFDIGLLLLEIIGAINITIAVFLHTLPSMKYVFGSNIYSFEDNIEYDEPFDKGLEIEDEEEVDYPYLATRVKAAFIDSMLMGILLILVLQLFSDGNNGLEIFIFFSIVVFVYEPVLLTLYAATIGQKLMGITVRRNTDFNKKINLFRAILRVLTKYTLGWLSFFTINFNKKHMAIHDFAGASIVLNVNTSKSEESEDAMMIVK
ncbi:RDD family protein [Flammeovirga aprica]|uniref:RDD family protein n=1 Tax=Flammeovirga aprica JL-4 TaxID=694437 RepID=A0A7X9RU09_9BACT|nr:RDD family protein [Flammeovirga aprica]NME68464.1 RDD family protein [Flammeovirga aprica JL-4]